MAARRLRRTRRSLKEKSIAEEARLKFGNKHGQINFFGLSKNMFRNVLDELCPGEPKERVQQLWTGIYKRRCRTFSDFKLEPSTLETLNNNFTLEPGRVMNLQASEEDGTTKWLTNLRLGGMVESVYIPDEKNDTLCLSSQVGCALTCSFCHTGAQDKSSLRNLTTDEIVGQVVNAKYLFDDFDESERKNKRMKPNIVFMGQGEPLYNLANLTSALDILLEKDGLNFGRRRITVSTSGVVPGIKALAEGGYGIELAISLHAPNNELRNELVPLNKTYDLESLIDAAREYSESITQKYISFEYVLLDKVNDTKEHAKELCILLRTLPNVIVNLIPFNHWEGTKYETPSNNRIHTFRKEVQTFSKNRIIVTIRKPRGRDIMGACGQLNTAFQNAQLKVEENL